MPLFSSTSTANSVLAGFLAAVAAYLTADLVIYPRYGNFPAVVADALISAAVLVEISYLAGTPLSLPGIGILSVIIAAGEWYYHSYLRRVLFSRRRR